MRRLLGFGVVALVAAACTPQQIDIWNGLDGDQRRAVSEHVIREAAVEYDVDARLMVRIADCESGLDPWARNPSGASGLFQHLSRYWPARAAAVGAEGAPWWDAVTNARAAAWMMSTQGTRPWNPSRSCWR